MTEVHAEPEQAAPGAAGHAGANMPPAASPGSTPSSAPAAPAVEPTTVPAVGDGGVLGARALRGTTRGHKPVRVVAARVPLRQRLVELWRNRELLAFLVRKEIKVKYKNSVLGFFWSMLNPALTLAVFWVLFTKFLPNDTPNFVIYMFSALLVWNLFQTAVLGATGTIVNNGGIVKKVAFPREILALASVGSAFVFFLFQSIVLVAFMVGFRHAPRWGELWTVVPALAALMAFAAALSVFLAAVNVYLRDTQHLVEVALMAWFWAVPAVYLFPVRVHDGLARYHLLWLYLGNPVTPIAMTFQRVFYAQADPLSTQRHVHQLVHVLPHYPLQWYLAMDCSILGVSLVLLLGALAVFGRLEGNFAEEL